MLKHQALKDLTNLAQTTNYIRDRLAYGAKIPEDVYNLWLCEVEYASEAITEFFEEEEAVDE